MLMSVLEEILHVIQMPVVLIPKEAIAASVFKVSQEMALIAQVSCLQFICVGYGIIHLFMINELCLYFLS